MAKHMVYARVSAKTQITDRQQIDLLAAGVRRDDLYIDGTAARSGDRSPTCSSNDVPRVRKSRRSGIVMLRFLKGIIMSKPYPPVFPACVLALLRAGKTVPEVAWELDLSEATDLATLSKALNTPIEVLPDMPVLGTTFPARGRWHIHISDSLDPAAQMRTALHELKHVIDHSMRRKANAPGFSDADYERPADFFADLVLRESHP